MMQTLEFRTPGVFFLPRPTEQRLRLPALDVAAFVGFAERGPLHVPVAVEDYGIYQKVFGGDLPLAQDAAGKTIYANLPRSVQSFFANGGRRCYVVRVAGPQAEAAQLRLPGVVALDANAQPRLAVVTASSPGAWGAALRLATRLAVSPLPPSAFGWASAADGTAALRTLARLARSSVGTSVRAGDVLRLQLGDGSRWLVPIMAIEPEAVNAEPQAGGVRDPSPRQLLRLGQRYRLHEPLAASPPERVEQAALVTPDGETTLASAGDLVVTGDGSSLELHADDSGLIRAGDVLHVQFEGRPPGDLGYLARVAALRARHEPASPPEAPGQEMVLSEFMQIAPGDWPLDPATSPPAPAQLATIELLRVQLLVRLGDDQLPAAGERTFNAATNGGDLQPPFWGDAVLLDSTLLDGYASRSGQTVAATTRATGSPITPQAAAARWFRLLLRDPYDVLPVDDLDTTQQAEADGFSVTAAWAGLLAPVGSHLGVAWATAQSPDGYAAADEAQALTYLPLGLAEFFDEGDATQFLPPEPGRSGDDDLDTFAAAYFYDDRLAPPGASNARGLGESHRTLLQTAFDLHYIQGRALRGVHSLLFIDEVALLAAPDAPHHPWQPGEVVADVAPPKPEEPPGVPACPPTSTFVACDRAPTIRRVEPYYGPLDQATAVRIFGDFPGDGELRLLFGLREATGVQVIDATTIEAVAPPGVRPEPVDVRIENQHGSNVLPGAFIYTRAAQETPLPVVIAPAAGDPVDEAPYLTIHQALAILCQARRDVVTVLTMPADYEVDRCLEWQQALRARLGLPALESEFAVDEPDEIADLSFAAVYHPWLLGLDVQAADHVRRLPPDGAICGMIAARERARQVWVAPANLPLNEVLGLEPALNDDDWARLFAQRFNLVRPEAADFRAMSAHTLSGDYTLAQLSVRRLMILLRKAALQLGMDFVFESNHAVFREGVRVTLEELLRYLFERGAFAGRTEAQSFRVITDDSVNPPQSVELGRFIVVIQVAPSQPMEFITVRITRTGAGELLAVEA